jgi:hypothetical protein
MEDQRAYVKHYLDNIDNIPEEWSIRFQQSNKINFAKPPRRVFGSNDWEATDELKKVMVRPNATKIMKSFRCATSIKEAIKK